MKKILGFLALTIVFACSRGLEEKRLLVVYEPDQKEIAKEIDKLTTVSTAHNIKIDTSSNLSIVQEDTLKFYSTVIFLGVPGEKLDYRQQTDLERYVQAGGGIMGVRTNLSPQYQWPWHQTLISKAKENTEGDTTTQKISFDGGSAVFTPSLLNYTNEALAEILSFSINDNVIDYEAASSLRVPEKSHFTRIVLDNDINEPMELDVLPDGKVIFIERRGKVKLYDPEKKSTKVLATFDVTTEGNYEDGLLGVALDPAFERNRWVYFFYSAPNPDSVNRLSRFYLLEDSLVTASEKVILEVPVQRYTCCHTGGSIQFGPDGLMYLSTGDNTSSKESNGYTPIDERPGRAPFDAQKSSANTQDLRGKILRIKINDDGSYSIPEGNLFSKDGKEGRPEIYIMGTRNPFRISIDWKNGWLYWGDVGPDGGRDGVQGPKSYDEWNQAREAGNYGWPYFVADNKAYPDWDFTTNTPGAFFDPEKPINDSPNNDGSKVLPPAQPAMIWYPYDESKIWPNLGTGSRSAMAGPVYYSDRYPDSDVKFPAYYDGKLFIYEWSRSWIKVVTFDEAGHPIKIEPFLPEIMLSKPIELEFGPKGAMYVLEYGANYFADNDEARLVKIEYTEGNRKPIANIAVDQKAGGAPFTVEFSALGSYDYDQKDKLSYAWKFSGKEVQSTKAEETYTFEKPGVYVPMLVVTDDHGNTATATTEILVGNAPPEIEIDFEGNQSFYYENESLPYDINVRDQEDGSIKQGGIDPARVKVSFDYLQQSKDLALLSRGARISPYMEGRKLIDESDCKSCHDMEKQSIGPSYMQVAERYHDDPEAVDMLAKKIITGGNGNWGHSLMAAHPQHSEEETTKMVQYILSLADEEQGQTTPLSGTLTFNALNPNNEEGTYYLSINYTDKGANNMPAITAREMVTFRHPKVQAETYELYKNVARQRPQGGEFAYVGGIQNGSYIVFENIDLTDIASLTYNLSARPAPEGGKISLRLDGPDGKQVSQTIVSGTEEGFQFKEITTPVAATEGLHDLYFVFEHDKVKGQGIFLLDWIYFHHK